MAKRPAWRREADVALEDVVCRLRADFDVSSMIERGTPRRSAGTGPWSVGLEPAEPVSTHSGDCPWREEGEGCRDGSGPAGEREH